MTASGTDMHCINCHSFRNWHTDNMQFHVRQMMGGTILYTNGHLSKLNLKTENTISSGVYPSWHPTHDYIAYSTNRTFQNLHTINTNRVEVFDDESDLILYNISNNSVSIIENDSTELECFPYWSPDGKTLYYVSAHIGNPTQFKANGGAAADLNIRYNLYSKSFDPDTRTWGPRKLVIRADSMQKSITLPRVSPDGRRLMFTMGSQGVFHIWHKDSQLYMMDLKDNSYRCLDEINSPDVESYHSWSSSGRWVVFSSRREDSFHTRLYLTYMYDDGSFSKPFILPQKDPEFSRKFMYSFNIPEFTVDPVRISSKEFASFIKNTDATPVSTESKIGE
jgi:Tol biopolymer transport system component